MRGAPAQVVAPGCDTAVMAHHARTVKPGMSLARDTGAGRPEVTEAARRAAKRAEQRLQAIKAKRAA